MKNCFSKIIIRIHKFITILLTFLWYELQFYYKFSYKENNLKKCLLLLILINSVSLIFCETLIFSKKEQPKGFKVKPIFFLTISLEDYIGLGRLVSLFVIVETEKNERLAINVKQIISVNSIRITKKSVNSSDKYYKLIRSNLFSSWYALTINGKEVKYLDFINLNNDITNQNEFILKNKLDIQYLLDDKNMHFNFDSYEPINHIIIESKRIAENKINY